MEELLEFLKEHNVVEIVLFRTQFVASCYVVYFDDTRFLFHYFSLEDFEEASKSLIEDYKLESSIEEIKFVPVEGDIVKL